MTFNAGTLEADVFDLMLSIEGVPAIACTNNEISDALDAAWLTRSEGTIARIAVFPAVGLTSDVTFGE